MGALDDVQKSCFGQFFLASHNKDISAFEQSYLGLGMKMTPKVHALCLHAPEFARLRGIGLGKISEQGLEAVHQVFAKGWSRYKVPKFQLLKAVICFNGYRM